MLLHTFHPPINFSHVFSQTAQSSLEQIKKVWTEHKQNLILWNFAHYCVYIIDFPKRQKFLLLNTNNANQFLSDNWNKTTRSTKECSDWVLRRRMKLGKRRVFEEVLISLVNLIILFQPEISDTSSKTDIPLVLRDGGSKLKEKGKAFDEKESRNMERFQRLGIFSIFTIQALAMGILSFFPPEALLQTWSEHETMVSGNITMGLGWFLSNASRCLVISFGGRQRCPFHDFVFYIWLVQMVMMVLSGLVLHFYIMRPSNERRKLSGQIQKRCFENLKPLKAAACLTCVITLSSRCL